MTNRALDIHREKDFSDTSVEAVSAFIGPEKWILCHDGLIPDTFKGLENARFAFAHIDVDTLVVPEEYWSSTTMVLPRVRGRE